jgi:hypothetical protein
MLTLAIGWPSNANRIIQNRLTLETSITGQVMPNCTAHEPPLSMSVVPDDPSPVPICLRNMVGSPNGGSLVNGVVVLITSNGILTTAQPVCPEPDTNPLRET